MNRRLGLLLILPFALAATGCVIMSDAAFVPQTHFSYPNSNVEPIGAVSGSAASTNLMFPNLGAALVEQAYRDALSKKGGDLLINVTVLRKARSFLNLVVTTSVAVDGTAAKMTVGGKKISLLQEEQVRDLTALAARSDETGRPASAEGL